MAVFGFVFASWFATCLAGLSLFPCPLRIAAGVGCPGCGLGRSMAALVRFDLREALELHALGPLVMLALGAIGLAAFGPEAWRERLVRFGSWLARPVPTVGLFAIVLSYWLARLAFERIP